MAVHVHVTHTSCFAELVAGARSSDQPERVWVWCDTRTRLGLEASTNIRYAKAMAYLTLHVYYSTNGDLTWSTDGKEPSPGDAYLEWLNSCSVGRTS